MIQPWLSFFGVVAIFVFIGYVVRVFILNGLEQIFSQAENKIDDLILVSIRKHIPSWFLMLGVYSAAHWIQLPSGFISFAEKICVISFFISFSMAFSHFLIALFRSYSATVSVSLPTTTLTENLIRIIVFGLGLLLILSNLGISIAPLLTALGVGSLAVALALQDTLSNLFSGIYIILNRQIQIGDYIRLESGQEGYILDIGWRSTKMRELPNNIILVPNVKLSQLIVTNYHQPEKAMTITFQVGVSYESNLEKVEKVTVEIARQVLKEVQGGVEDFEPIIRYHTFGDSSINFIVVLKVQEFTDRYLVTHEFIKKLHQTFQQQQIIIPFPHQVVRVEKTL